MLVGNCVSSIVYLLFALTVWIFFVHSRFYTKYHYVFLTAAVLYYPTIFGIRYLLKDSAPYDLGGAPTTVRDIHGTALHKKPSTARINYIFFWELGLALFSVAGAYNVVPLALESLASTNTLTEAICLPQIQNDPRAWWIFVFQVSKLFEFGDTLFVVLRKKNLILLQHYHHLATFLYCWWGALNVMGLNNTNPFFAAMNLVVHSFMYTWYAATRTGWRSPKWMMMAVTLIQLVQMVLGVIIVLIAQTDVPECRWSKGDPWGAKAATFMYVSYLLLFGKLFYDNYIKAPLKKKERKD